VDKDKGREEYASRYGYSELSQTSIRRKATEKIVTTNGDVISANIVNSSEAEGYGYMSHFATCPGAVNHRKK